jgi:hypothetical protein
VECFYINMQFCCALNCNVFYYCVVWISSFIVGYCWYYVQ